MLQTIATCYTFNMIENTFLSFLFSFFTYAYMYLSEKFLNIWKKKITKNLSDQTGNRIHKEISNTTQKTLQKVTELFGEIEFCKWKLTKNKKSVHVLKRILRLHNFWKITVRSRNLLEKKKKKRKEILNLFVNMKMTEFFTIMYRLRCYLKRMRLCK